jgi:hypothetical protein
MSACNAFDPRKTAVPHKPGACDNNPFHIFRSMNIQLELSQRCRERLLDAFPPSLPKVVCDHVTLYYGKDSRQKRHLFGKEFETGWEVVGYVSSEHVVALVVAHNGSTVREHFDRKVYHCTHSLSEGHYAKESNDLIENHGWRALPGRLPLEGKIKLAK